jgi:hypothetical protein
MTSVAGEIAKLDALLAGEVAAINDTAREHRVAHITG